jgi:putative oxidoreductase
VLENMARNTFVPLILRGALAMVFIYHGLEKVDAENGYGLKWAEKMQNPPSQVLQGLVAWGELLGGCAIALGLATRIAALGIILIMVGAITTVHLPHGFSLASPSGPGYEYNVVLIAVAACLVLGGAGTFSLDRVIRIKSRGRAQY